MIVMALKEGYKEIKVRLPMQELEVLNAKVAHSRMTREKYIRSDCGETADRISSGGLQTDYTACGGAAGHAGVPPARRPGKT